MFSIQFTQRVGVFWGPYMLSSGPGPWQARLSKAQGVGFRVLRALGQGFLLGLGVLTSLAR